METKFKGIAYIRIESQTTTLDKYPDKKRLLWKKLVQETFEEGNEIGRASCRERV